MQKHLKKNANFVHGIKNFTRKKQQQNGMIR